MDIYKIAHELAGDLAEDYLASNIADMMITGGRDKAKFVRDLSDSNKDQVNKHDQRYRSDCRVIYGSLCSLLEGEGYKGYKIVKTE